MDGRHPDPHQLLRAIRRVRFRSRRRRCPRCEHPRTQRWGTFSGRQRYRCLGCSRTFSDLTGTPLHYSKRLDLWDQYATCILFSLPVRGAAAVLGVDKNTAFRWRHLLLAAYRARENPGVSGEVEVIRTRIPCIGSPEPGRSWAAHRRRGLDPRPHSWSSPHGLPEVVSGLLLYVRGREEGWEVRLGRITRFLPPSQEDLFMELLPRLIPPVTLIGEPEPYLNLWPVAAAAGAELVLTRPGRAADRQAHRHRPASPAELDPTTRRVRAYQRRFRCWVARFFGVSERYVANYFCWHRFLERSWGQAIPPEATSEAWATGPEEETSGSHRAPATRTRPPATRTKRLARRFLMEVCISRSPGGRRSSTDAQAA
jgi:transposase-like protein